MSCMIQAVGRLCIQRQLSEFRGVCLNRYGIEFLLESRELFLTLEIHPYFPVQWFPFQTHVLFRD